MDAGILRPSRYFACILVAVLFLLTRQKTQFSHALYFLLPVYITGLLVKVLLLDGRLPAVKQFTAFKLPNTQCSAPIKVLLTTGILKYCLSPTQLAPV